MAPGNGAGTNGYRLGNVGAVPSTCEKPTDGNFIVVDFADALLANPERDLDLGGPHHGSGHQNLGIVHPHRKRSVIGSDSEPRLCL